MNTVTAFLRKNSVPLLIAICLLAVGSANPVFLSASNLINILLQASIIGVIALGMTFVIIVGGIDLSVGSIAALTGVVLARLLSYGLPESSALIIAISVGILCGAINGLFVIRFGVPSFIATLGMMGIARGFSLFLSDGRPLSDIGEVSTLLGAGSAFGLPLPVILFLSLAICLELLLRQTIWGTRIYAVGGNPRAAWIAGVNIDLYTWFLFVACALAAATGGILVAGRIGSAQPLAGNLYELDAITAVVVGGGTLSGGRGSILGSATGAILLSAMRNAMVVNNLSPYMHQIVIGAVLIMVLSINRSGRND